MQSVVVTDIEIEREAERRVVTGASLVDSGMIEF